MENDQPQNGAAREEAGGVPDPALIEKIKGVRAKVHESFGQVALAMTATPRYRHLSIADLRHLLLEPLIRDRVAIASTAQDPTKLDAPVGVAIWASVSEEVDAKLREQIKAGVFPARLQPEDWTSGSINWLLDVIAPNQKSATAVLANFKQVAKEGELRVHPLVARLVDAELLKQMARRPTAAQRPEAVN